MKIHDLTPPPGSNRRKKRVARGIGGKGGKTAGRGTKGQKARGSIPAGFEGGQMPLHIRVPKLRGFTNPFRVESQVVTLADLSGLPAGSEITREALTQAGLIKARKGPPKILASGELSHAVVVKGVKVSAGAKSRIEAAGGRVEE